MFKGFNRILKNKFIQGGMIFTAAIYITGILNYFFNSLAAKTLGPQGYSEITALFSYLTILSVPIAVVSTDIIRRLGGKGEKRKEAFYSWDGWIWALVSKWIFLVIPYCFLILIIPRLFNINIFSSITLLFLLPTSILTAYYTAAFQGLQLFLFASLITIIPQIFKVSGPIFAQFSIDKLSIVLIFINISGLSSILISRYLISTVLSPSNYKKSLSSKSITRVLFSRQLLITIFSLVSINLLNNLDVIFVKKFYPSAVAGLYGGWSLFAKIIFYAFGSIIGLSLIFFSSKEHEKHHKRTLIGLLIIICFGGIASFFFYKLFGAWVVQVMLSTQYNSIVTPLPLAALFGSFYSVLFLLNNFFLAKNSPFSLIVTLGVPLYICGLLFFGKSLQDIYYVNVLSSFAIMTAYILAIFYYNRKLWSRKNKHTS